MTLNEQMDLVRKRELAARLDQGEAEIHARIADQLPQPAELDSETLEDLRPWLAWTTARHVRHAPARPYVIAAFIAEQSASGTSTNDILRQLDAVARLHDKFSLPNPVATAAARAVLEREFAFAVPRSWTGPEKEMFVTLPAEIRAAISRREQDRETTLRRAQNNLAAERKRLQADAETKSAEQPKETTTMAKWNGKQGSSDMERDPLIQGTGPFKAPKWRQITPGKLGPAPDLGDEIEGRVNKAQTVHEEGFSARLPKSK
jgi:hypothetical protein